MTVAPIQLFSTDLDGTLLGDTVSAQRFKTLWPCLSSPYRPLLCYNTGRLLDDVRQLIETDLLPKPDYIISGVGTSVFDYAANRRFSAFTQTLEIGWDRARVEQVMLASALPLSKQPDYFQTPHKSSWYLDDATPTQLADLSHALSQAGLAVSLIYSSRQDLDILPQGANKGRALAWLAAHLGIPLAEVLVAGDTGNDSAMFALAGVRGILPGNAHGDLIDQVHREAVYLAPTHEICAQGVLAGLAHYGVLRETEPDQDLPA